VASPPARAFEALGGEAAARKRSRVMRFIQLLQRTGAAIGLALIASSIAAAQGGDAAAGKTVFTKSCAGCHGAAGEGKETLAKALKVEMHPLGSQEVQSKSDEQIRKDVTQGVGKMKPVAKLNDQDVTNVVAYVRSLKQ
jgi:mono/diheme cytochrome c family protein